MNFVRSPAYIKTISYSFNKYKYNNLLAVYSFSRDFSSSPSEKSSVSAYKFSNIHSISELRENLVNQFNLFLKQRKESKQPIEFSEKPVRMRDSFLEAILVFEGSQQLKYLSLYNTVRIGKLFEDLDTFAVAVAARHCTAHLSRPNNIHFLWPPTFYLVTALVDKIELSRLQNLPVKHPIKFSGLISWAGRSSLEVSMSLHQLREACGTFHDAPGAHSKLDRFTKAPAPPGFEWHHLMDARFLMVARDARTHKAHAVNSLDLRTPVEVAMAESGDHRSARRKRFDTESVLRTVPTQYESEQVHRMFLSSLDVAAGSLNARLKPPNTVWLTDTALKTLMVCHAEERNIHNKIFGGFLMRQAYELAWSCAHIHLHRKPLLVAVDDFKFHVPVDIGSFLLLSSQVVYVSPERQHLTVRVHVELFDPFTHSRSTTHTAYFVFAPDVSPYSRLPTGFSVGGPDDSASASAHGETPDAPQELVLAKNVLPDTYGAALLYLQGKRHYEHLISDRSSESVTCENATHWMNALGV